MEGIPGAWKFVTYAPKGFYSQQLEEVYAGLRGK